MKIFRNFRLDRVFEIDFSIDFHIKTNKQNVRYLIVKKSKFTHKNE